MLTLAVTSSTAVVGVAVVRSPEQASTAGQASTLEILSHHHLSTDRRHAEEITPMIQGALADAGVQITELDRLAVDVGPGRFTGLRVGIATVRTLAFALSCPVVGITSLEALAASQPRASVTAVIDARRAEVFQQRFGPDGPIGEPTYGPPEEMAQAVQAGDVIVGDGADRYPDAYQSIAGATYIAGVEPMASHIATLSVTREAVAGPTISPLYLRDPDVQVNIKTRHNT